MKAVAKSGWFAARPSGTEAICKIYAESFRSEAHLRRILADAQAVVSAAIGGTAAPAGPVAPVLHQKTEREAVEVWENEGDPN